MADLPRATTRIDDQAGAFAGSTGYCVIMACAALNADAVPRVYSSTKGVLSQHGYCQGADYAAHHLEKTGKPVIFVGLPIVTAGAVSHRDDTAVEGTSTISVSAGANGILEEADGRVEVITGGTVGVHGIVIDVSIDGGKTKTRVRLGTATTYTIPYVGIVLTFGGGTLELDDLFIFRTTAPSWNSAGITSARTALAAQQKLARTWMVIGDVATASIASDILTQAEAYHTTNEREVGARVQVKDYEPLAKKTILSKHMTGAPAITFAEVGATGDTITRDAGSFITDGFAVGDYIVVAGSASNNVTGVIASLSGTVITLDATDLVNESAAAGAVSIAASETLTFAEVGATGDTITRSSGSWTAEGFAVGDTVVFTGTASNNVTGVIGALSSTVMTLTDTDLTAEVIAGHLVTITKSQTLAAYIAAQDAAFAAIDDAHRINLGIGRARTTSPITGAKLRRPAQWFACLREFQHDLHIPTFRKADGPLTDCSITDDNGNADEFDERLDGGALAGRFTCLRSWANGPNGAFVALDLTRANEASLLSRHHNASVARLACTVAQSETENTIGQVLELNDDGTATQASLSIIESRVNTALANNLLADKEGEGKRASLAVWQASRSDVLNVPGATLNGVLTLNLNGTIEKINTVVRVLTGGLV